MQKTLEEVKRGLWTWHDGGDISNDIHVYFEMANPRDWVDVSDAACDVWKAMFDEEIEEYSPIDAIFSGIAAQAAHGAWSAVADAFGLERQYVELVLARWYEDKENLPAPISPEEFIRLYEEEKKSWEKQDANS